MSEVDKENFLSDQECEIVYVEAQAPKPWDLRKPYYDKDLPFPEDFDSQLSGGKKISSFMVPSPLMRLKTPSSISSYQDSTSEDGRISPVPSLDRSLKSEKRGLGAVLGLANDSITSSESLPQLYGLFNSPNISGKRLSDIKLSESDELMKANISSPAVNVEMADQISGQAVGDRGFYYDSMQDINKQGIINNIQGTRNSAAATESVKKEAATAPQSLSSQKNESLQKGKLPKESFDGKESSKDTKSQKAGKFTKESDIASSRGVSVIDQMHPKLEAVSMGGTSAQNILSTASGGTTLYGSAPVAMAAAAVATGTGAVMLANDEVAVQNEKSQDESLKALSEKVPKEVESSATEYQINQSLDKDTNQSLNADQLNVSSEIPGIPDSPFEYQTHPAKNDYQMDLDASQLPVKLGRSDVMPTLLPSVDQFSRTENQGIDTVPRYSAADQGKVQPSASINNAYDGTAQRDEIIGKDLVNDVGKGSMPMMSGKVASFVDFYNNGAHEVPLDNVKDKQSDVLDNQGEMAVDSTYPAPNNTFVDEISPRLGTSNLSKITAEAPERTPFVEVGSNEIVSSNGFDSKPLLAAGVAITSVGVAGLMNDKSNSTGPHAPVSDENQEVKFGEMYDNEKSDIIYPHISPFISESERIVGKASENVQSTASTESSLYESFPVADLINDKSDILGAQAPVSAENQEKQFDKMYDNEQYGEIIVEEASENVQITENSEGSLYESVPVIMTGAGTLARNLADSDEWRAYSLHGDQSSVLSASAVIDQNLHVFDSILKEELPELSDHLVLNGITSDLYAEPWFANNFDAPEFSPAFIQNAAEIYSEKGPNGQVELAIDLMRENNDDLLALDSKEGLLDKLTNGMKYSREESDDLRKGELEKQNLDMPLSVNRMDNETENNFESKIEFLAARSRNADDLLRQLAQLIKEMNDDIFELTNENNKQRQRIKSLEEALNKKK